LDLLYVPMYLLASIGIEKYYKNSKRIED
jgi:hypothetical protein